MERLVGELMMKFSESLAKIVQEKDFEFLRKTAAESEAEFLRKTTSEDGNIFHFAAYEDSVEFLEEATKILRSGNDRLVQYLYCQQQSETGGNPLHVAAMMGRHKIVKVILDYYRSLPEHDSFDKPWLALDENGNTPLHLGLLHAYDGLALDIMSMDAELLCDMANANSETPTTLAVVCGRDRVSIQILTSAPNCSLFYKPDFTTLSHATHGSAQVFKMLVEKAPQHIIGHDHTNGETILHAWVKRGRLFPLEYVLNKNDNITPDLRKDFISQLCCKEYETGWNPLHYILNSLNDDAFSVTKAKILVDAYTQEMGHLELEVPWLMEDKHEGLTPLHVAIAFQREKLALYFFSLDSLKFLQRDVERCANGVDVDKQNLLMFAIKRNCPEVAEEILRVILENEENANLSQLLTFKDGESVMSYAPYCTEMFLKQLLKTHPEFITQRIDSGDTVLHQWIIIGKVWPFEYIIKAKDINPQCKFDFMELIGYHNSRYKVPIQLAASSCMRKEMYDFVKSYHDVSNDISKFIMLWSTNFDDGNSTALEIAISNTSEELVLLFLSTDPELELVGIDIMFQAIKYECHKVVEYLLDWSIQHEDKKFLVSTDFGNVLHVVWKSTEENGRRIVEKWPEFINDSDKFGKTPLQRASEAGKAWLVKLILQQDLSSFRKTPLAWVAACEEGHVSAVLAFVENSPYFRSICHEQEDTPLHHIRNTDYKGYQELLKNKFIVEMKNTQNKVGETPLHIAIKHDNLELAEILLTTNGMELNLKDDTNERVKDLLNEKCDKDNEWKSMCKLTGVHRTLKSKYIEANTNVMEMRGTISVVATLLATITITAGFAVPGGIDSNGDAILSGTITFWVFIISNAYAMCCAILILFCNTWSMVSDIDMSSILLDRSLWLLKQSLYGTLVAFTLAMYTVIHKKSFWAAIVVIVMVCLVVVLAQRRVLYKILRALKDFEENPPPIIKKIRSLLFHCSCYKRKTSESATNDIENQAGEVEAIATTSGVKKSS